MSIPIYDFYRINFPETPEIYPVNNHSHAYNHAKRKKRPEVYPTSERMYNAIYI